MVDIKYTQNFYNNTSKISKLVSSIEIKENDIVLDVGAGKGILTNELGKYSKNVIAYELDSEYYEILKHTFHDRKNILLVNEDFTQVHLPKKPFKVFANIPFSLTADIVNKITSDESQLSEAYLFVQKESGDRFVGKPRNTQIANILSYRFNTEIIDTFERGDFKPIPNVDIVLLKIVRKKNIEGEYLLFKDFVTYIFNQMENDVFDTLKKLFTFNQLKYIKEELKKENYTVPSDIPKEYFLKIFQYFKTNGLDYRNRVNGYYKMHIFQHAKREKINKTRV
ncbi:hypothetical protein KBB69_02155 [Candidatus Dojkabacteria bacterium]|nr:hypothetical protein [Candidatus Dojkabacteria bacterium]